MDLLLWSDFKKWCLLYHLLCFNNILYSSTAHISTPVLHEAGSITEISTNDTDNIINVKNISTPFGVQLSGIYKRSLAYRCLRVSSPIVLDKVIDSLNNDKEEIIQLYGQSSTADCQQVILSLNELKRGIISDTPLTPLVYSTHENNTNSDVKIWNDYLIERTNIEGRVPTWYNSSWIYSESYMYQKLANIFQVTETLQSYDPFMKQKKQAFDGSLNSIISVATYIIEHINASQVYSLDVRKQEFNRILRLDLWSNRCDLVVTMGNENGQVGKPLEFLDYLDQNILVDDTEVVWEQLTKAQPINGSIIVDIVLDNAGYEFFTDLCIAAFLIAHNLAHKVRFYVKQVPWYISDITVKDFHWTIEHIRTSSNAELSQFGNVIKDHLETGVWTIEEESFWTNTFMYPEMSRKDPVLYAKLAQANLIIIKGDLNYRKLVGDVNWEYNTSFVDAIQGFLPTNIVSLRTVKGEICVGLQLQEVDSLYQKNVNWMLTAEYGLIQSAINV